MTKLKYDPMFSNLSMLAALAALTALTSCSNDDEKPNRPQGVGTTSHPLVIVTERQGPDTAFHYLHVVPDWPSTGELDYDRAIELGTPGVTYIEDDAILFYHAEEGEIKKFFVDDDLTVSLGDEISFAHYGITGFDPEPIWVDRDLAFMLDEKSAQIARWSPHTMKIESVDPLSDEVRQRDGLNVQFQRGIAAAGRLFTAVNWRNWNTNQVHQAAALGIFDQDAPANGPQVVEDDRCAASVAVGPFKDADGYIYAVGDGAQGFDLAANPNKSPNPQCVVRMHEEADEFDSSFFVNLQTATGSPAIYMVYPMAQRKVLVNMWSPDVDIESVADPEAPGWYWELHPNYEYAIVDLTTGTSTKVAGLPRASIQSQKTLFMDDKNYVQQFRADRGSTLHEIDADGTVTQVLDNPTGTNVQYIGRL